MKNVRLNNGVMMPAIGFGVFQIPENETERAVNDAIEIGYRKFDTAAAYFNEEQLGNAIRQSGIKREEFFITTKLWVQDYEYDDALRAFDLSMKKLGLDYLDLYLMHKPYGNYYAAWRAMERLYKEGRIRAIGVTSFSNERLQDLFLHNEIKPVVNQLETHPFFQQQAANAFLQQEGIQHEAWAPFAEGQNDIFNHPTLKAIAEQHDKGVGAIILRWLNQRNIVVIPKSVHKERMIENFNILDFTLSKEEMDAIALLESPLAKLCDVTLAVVAPAEIRVKRIMDREGITEEYAWLRVKAQKSDEYFVKGCDRTLVNDCDQVEEFALQAKALVESILQEHIQ